MDLVALVSLDLGMLCLSGPGPSWPARLKSILGSWGTLLAGISIGLGYESSSSICCCGC